MMRRQLLPLFMGLVMALLHAPAALGASCGSAPFFVCLAGTVPSRSVSNATSLCQSLQRSLEATTSNPPSWPSDTRCTMRQPTTVNITTKDSLFYFCGSVTSPTVYARLVASVWGMTSPNVNSGFRTRFLNMYNNAANRNDAAATLWSYFSCRSSRMPSGSKEEAWQLQFYVAGTALSPPPPLSGSSQRTAIVLQGSSGTTGRRLLLQDVFGPGRSMLGAQGKHSLAPGWLGSSQVDPLDQLASTGGAAAGVVEDLRRRLLQTRRSPPPPFSFPPPPPSSSSSVAVTFVITANNINFNAAAGLLAAVLAALGSAQREPTTITSGAYVGGASLGTAFDSPANASAFFNYVTTQPGLDQFVTAAIANGGMPCGSGTTLIITDSFNIPYFNCNGSSYAAPYYPVRALPSMCCGPTQPRSPPAPPSLPVPTVPLDNATVQVFQDLGIPTVVAYPYDPLPAVTEAPSYLIVAPYLAPSFITTYLADDRGLAQSYIDFVEGGGVLLVLASFQSALSADDVCSAPFAVLRSVLGPRRLRSCSCSSPGPNDIVATLNYTAAAAVLGTAGADSLAAVQGPDFPVSLPVVGGVPLTCTPGLGGRDDYDLLPVNTGVVTVPPLIPGNEATGNQSTAPTFVKANGAAELLAGPAPAGYRSVSCEEAQQYEATIIRAINASELCGVDGGVVTHTAVTCDESAAPLTNLTCRILAFPSPPPPPPAPLAPSPPADNSTNSSASIRKLGPDSPLPAGYRPLTCAEAQQYRTLALAVLNTTDVCTLYTGTATTLGRAQSRVITCSSGGYDNANCQLAIRPNSNITAGSSLVKAWQLGLGWVVYAGANVNVANNSLTYADVSFWNQFLLSINAISLPFSTSFENSV